jgi:S-formylglutathione hydrolase FrmB
MNAFLLRILYRGAAVGLCLWPAAFAHAGAAPLRTTTGGSPVTSSAAETTRIIAAVMGPPAPAPRPELPACPSALDAKAGGRWFATKVAVPAGAGQAPAEVGMEFYLPAGFAHGKRYPLVVALHGWGHTPAHYRRDGNLAANADRAQAIVVVPNLGKSVYEEAFYPKVPRRWGPVPGLPFVGRTLLEWCRRELPVRPERRWTAIVGYSTGGRGAVAVAEAYPEFDFVGATSGTYDLFGLPPASGEYRIHAAALGPREPPGTPGGRWVRNDVAVDAHAAALGPVALYLAHGDADPAVPFDQLARMSAYLRRHGLSYSGCIGVKAGHDFRFWNASMTGMFARWREVLGGEPVHADAAAPTAFLRAAQAVAAGGTPRRGGERP